MANGNGAKRPLVFIGSSSESRIIARTIQSLLNDTCASQVWDESFFSPGQSYLEALTEQADRFDFAVLVLAGDDETLARGVVMRSPRDNVLFEAGLFMGTLGRARTFLVHSDENVKLPSDFAGITCVKYRVGDPFPLESILGPACLTI